MTIPVSVNPSQDSGRPTKLFTSREIGELSLQLIGAYSVNDTAPDAEELERALKWMELNIGQLAGTQSCWWLMKYDLTFDLEADTTEYDLLEAFGAAVPGQEVLYPVAAYLVTENDDGTPNEVEIELARSHRWLEDTAREQTGAPTMLHIGRDYPLKARPWPIPTDDTYSIRLVLQTFARSVLEKEGEQAGDAAHGFSQEWQRWLVHATGADIGNGPVRTLPESRVNGYRLIAGAARAELQAFSNREKRSGAARTEAWGA